MSFRFTPSRWRRLSKRQAHCLPAPAAGRETNATDDQSATQRNEELKDEKKTAMKRKIAVCASILVMWCPSAQAATVDIKGALIVCIGADALESVAGDWKKPGCSSSTRVAASSAGARIPSEMSF